MDPAMVEETAELKLPVTSVVEIGPTVFEEDVETERFTVVAPAVVVRVVIAVGAPESSVWAFKTW